MKIKCIYLILVLSFLLCGCSFAGNMQTPEQEYTVSSIGFNSSNSGFTVYFETLVVNSENADAETKRTLFTGEGSSVSEAVADALKKTAEPLNLSHAAMVILENGLTKDEFWEIYNYCYSNTQISVAIGFVLCEDVNSLLKCEPSASLSVGYDIANMLTTQSKRLKTKYQNRLYESAAKIDSGYWRLPLAVTVKDTFYIGGTKNQII